MSSKKKYYGGQQHQLWRKFRILILEAKNRQTCEHCGDNLYHHPIVHHISYEWGIFNLDLNNYLILCNICHKNLHKREKLGLSANAFVPVPHNETTLYEGIIEGRCNPPQSNSKLRQEKQAQGSCEMSCRSCSEIVMICPDCGYNYCFYHLGFHKNHHPKSDEKRLENFHKSAAGLLTNSNLSWLLNSPQACRVIASSHQ